jgi:hypothetical protein
MSFKSLFWSISIEFTYRYEDDAEIRKTNSIEYINIKNPEKVISLHFSNSNFIQNLKIELFPNIKSLVFDNIKFDMLNNIEIIGKCKKLNKLWFKNTNISYLSQFINSNNINLEFLLVDNCSNLDLIDIKQIKTLIELHINHSMICSLDEISDLTELRILNLRNNNLSSLKNIKKLVNLESLNIQYNLIENLDELSLIPNLKYLYADYNKIQYLWILPLLNLKYLEMSNNNLESIKILEFSPELEVVNIKNNPIKHLPNLSKIINLNYERFQVDWKNIISIDNMKSFGLIKNMILNIKYF